MKQLLGVTKLAPVIIIIDGDVTELGESASPAPRKKRAYVRKAKVVGQEPVRKSTKNTTDKEAATAGASFYAGAPGLAAAAADVKTSGRHTCELDPERAGDPRARRLALERAGEPVTLESALEREGDPGENATRGAGRREGITEQEGRARPRAARAARATARQEGVNRPACGAQAVVSASLETTDTGVSVLSTEEPEDEAWAPTTTKKRPVKRPAAKPRTLKG